MLPRLHSLSRHELKCKKGKTSEVWEEPGEENDVEEETEPMIEMERHRQATDANNEGIKMSQLNIRGVMPNRNEIISLMAAKKI